MSILFLLKTPVIFLFRFQKRNIHSYDYTLGKILYNAQKLILGPHSDLSFLIAFKVLVIIDGIVGFYYYLKNDENWILKTYIGISSILSCGGFIFLSLVLKLDEIKAMYFLFYVFVFNFVIFYFLNKISEKSVRKKIFSIIIALIYFGLLSTGLVRGILMEKSQLTKKAVFEMKSILGAYDGVILFSKYDAEYYMSGLYRSYFDEKIKLVPAFEVDLCEEEKKFFFLDSHNLDGSAGKELKERDCFNKFKLVQKKVYHTDMHPGPWAIFEFKRNLY